MPVRDASMMPAQCGEVVCPAVAKLSLPGRALANAMNSLTLDTGTLGCTQNRCGEYETMVTGVKSRCRSIVALPCMSTVIVVLPRSASRNV